MDIRKLQSTGGSSLSVILPKKWVISHSLKDKEEVVISENYSGEISISPLKIKEAKRHTVVDLDIIETGAIINSLKALYKVGYDDITFTSNQLESKSKSIIKKTARELLGFEIVEENQDRIVLKNLFDTNRMPVGLMQQKAITGTISMLEDSFEAIANSDSLLAQDVIERDEEIDKICLYIQRLYYSVLTGRVTEKEISINSLRLNYYKEIVTQIERIADNATKMARTIVVGGGLDKSDVEEFISRSSKIIGLTKSLADILISENYSDLNKISEKINNIKKQTFYNEEDYQNGTFKEAVVIDCLNRVRGQVKNIIEIINDYVIINS